MERGGNIAHGVFLTVPKSNSISRRFMRRGLHLKASGGNAFAGFFSGVIARAGRMFQKNLPDDDPTKKAVLR